MKIKRAIIMAAGKGERLRPITAKVPKPLVMVNGKRMIDTIIQALHQNDIYEIYVVVGYLKEAFKELPQVYQHLKLIENPYYETCNNISSMYVACDYLADSIVIDGDQIIRNAKVLRNEVERSGYTCFWTDKMTKEWLFQVDKQGIVTDCSRTGGQKGWQLFGVSRWNNKDGKHLAKLIKKEFELGRKDIYWDDVVMFLYRQEFELGYYPMGEMDILEIDSWQELLAQDKSYQQIKV